MAIVAGLVWGLIGARVITAKKMDREWVWIQGPGVDFLRAVPDVRGA
jgi:hypothetical protein